jgi:hypothetical protein
MLHLRPAFFKHRQVQEIKQMNKEEVSISPNLNSEDSVGVMRLIAPREEDETREFQFNPATYPRRRRCLQQRWEGKIEGPTCG